MWYVVVFPEENKVSTIPESWYIKSRNESFWPPPSEKIDINTLVKHCYRPKDNWGSYEAKVLGKYDNYKKAMEKLSKAKEKDSLVTTDQDEKSRKRYRKKQSKYDADFDTDGTDGESDDPNTYPSYSERNQESQKCNINNSKEETRHAALGKAMGEVNSLNFFLGKNAAISKEKSRKIFSRVRSRSLSPAPSPEKHPPFYTQGRVHIPVSSQDERPTSDSQVSANDVHDLTDSSKILELLRKIQSENNEFKIQILRKLNLMNMKLNDLEASLEGLNKNDTDQPEPEEMNNLLLLFPLNKEKLKQLETDLVHQEMKNKVSRHLSKLGGINVSEIVKRLMYKVFTNELGHLYSWDGAKGKEKFKHLQIADVILNAVRLNKNTQDATDSDVIVCIKKWLVRCRDRIQLANKRMRPNANDEKDAEGQDCSNMTP